MDNLTHTLVGAALSHAGLKKRTALASGTLMIGANFPDIDVVAVFFDNNVHWRRGHTHGFLALVILPFVLAWIMTLWDRHVRLRRNPGATPADPRQLLVLSAVSIATHPTLDFMNTYGMRWLMPFVNKWFYADGLFIIELWLWIALGLGVFLARRRASPRPARIALGFLVGYTVVMLGITGLGRRAVDAQLPGVRSMVGPVPVVPWRRNVLVDLGTSYQRGTWSPFGGLSLGRPFPTGEEHPAVALASQDRDAARFLIWARWPTYSVQQEGARTLVHIVDLRYGATRTVRLP